MGQDDQVVATSLANVRAEFETEHLLIRYASGRVAHFTNRQMMTLSGCAALGIMNSPATGLIALLIALLGEAVDCLYLRTVPRRLNRGDPVARVYAISTATAIFQAVCVSACIFMAWKGEVSHGSPLFAMAFLAGAAVNAGLVLPYQKTAAQARLAIYGGAAVLFHLADALILGVFSGDFLMNAMGSVILANMVQAYLVYINTGFHRNRQNLLAITDQGQALERANAQLLKSQKETQQLSLVARNANDSVILSDANGRIFWVNEAFTRITGYGPEDAIGNFPGQLLNGPETSTDTLLKLSAAITTGQPFRGEIQNLTRDGSQIWIETNQVPVLDANGEVEMIVSIERDITEAKQTAKDLIEAKARAEEAARAKADFLATMSHEIRTPMNGVIGMADLMGETDLCPEQKIYLETIRGSAQALLAIINDVLDMSKLDANMMELSPVDFDLHSCLRDTVLLLGAQARDKSLSLDLSLSPDLPDWIHADDGRLRQILINLVGNAIKFTDEGGVRIEVASEDRGNGPILAIKVRDSGIGIPAEKLDRVFERFSQADSATTRRFGGTGLGLTISRMLVEAMGGSISVASSVGEGSEFSVRIPVQLSAPPQTDQTRRPENTDDFELLRGRRILVAEDNRTNRLLIEKYLRGLPIELRFANDGQEAVDSARRHQPDLVLMDMSMPVMNGIEATTLIRSADHRQPAIVALTANAFDSDRQACLAAGMNGFLTKPVRRAELIDIMVAHCSVGQDVAQL